MELTNELKEKFENAATLEEKKDVLKQAGIELADDQLEVVAGGGSTTTLVYCPNCDYPVVVPPFEYMTLVFCEKCCTSITLYDPDYKSN